MTLGSQILKNPDVLRVYESGVKPSDANNGQGAAGPRGAGTRPGVLESDVRRRAGSGFLAGLPPGFAVGQDLQFHVLPSVVEGLIGLRQGLRLFLQTVPDLRRVALLLAGIGVVKDHLVVLQPQPQAQRRQPHPSLRAANAFNA